MSHFYHENARKGVLLHATLASFNFIKKQGEIKGSKVCNYDYIELGKEFSTRNFKDGFVVMRDFYVGLDGGPKTRNAKPSTWSVDLSVIDLPTSKSISSIRLRYFALHSFFSQRLLTGS